MEIVAEGRNWLDSLTERLRYKPKVVGADFQPLATSWETKALSSISSNRSGHGSIHFTHSGTSHVILAGGQCGSRGVLRNDVVCLTSGMDAGCESAPWSPRENFSFLSSSAGEFVYVLGGDDGELRSDVWLSRDIGKSFRCQCSSAPWGGRVDFAATLVGDDSIVIVGGRIPERPGLGRFLNDVWLSSDRGKIWVSVSENADWKPRAYSSLIYSQGTLLLIGGLTEVSVMDDVWASKDMGKTWELISLKCTPWKARRSCSLVANSLSNEILMFGGTGADGVVLSDSWATIDGGSTWHPRRPIPTVKTSSPTVSFCDSGVFALANGQTVHKSFTDLRFVAKDCRVLLMLGKRLEPKISKDIWIGHILPYAVDTRGLWERKDIPLKKFAASN